MAGYICKIVIEDTHPPVWRRVIIPDKITFRELHEVIQVLFEWQNAHLHGFNILADRISIDDIEETWGRQYAEAKTRIDSFFRNYKSIRYTYDFGGEWRHKINIEKMDEEYTERYATLLKFKGDNFIEDACWDMGDESRSPFDKEAVEKQLKDMKFPAHDEIEEAPLLKETFANLKSMFEGLCKMHPELLEEMPDAFLEKINPTEEVTREVNEWKIFEMDMIENTKSVSLKLVPPTKTQKELLMGLGEKEAKDYYKYLQLPLMNSLTKKDKVNEISKTLQNYPEYLLYIFDKNQFRDLADWIKFPQGISPKRPVNSGMIIKALSLGLMEFHRKGNTGEISFASDIHKFTDDLDVKIRKRVYQELKEFDSNFAKIIQIYSLIELESLYEIYQKIYGVKIEKKKFFRYIYWHARFNSFVYTYYMADGTCYVASVEVDAEAIINRIKKYEEQLPYIVYSAKELDDRGVELINRSDWMKAFYLVLSGQLEMDPYEAEECMIETVEAIINGDPIDQVTEELTKENSQLWNLSVSTSIWRIVSGLMLDLELPMLKGRCRKRYAEEQKISPWSVDMVEESEDVKNTKERRMSQFPEKIQEYMHEADNSGSEEAIHQLLEYKKQNHVCSEEYICLLAEICTTFEKTKIAEDLIKELKKSSVSGKKEAEVLGAQLLQESQTNNKNEEEWLEEMDYGWEDMIKMPLPYVRTEPKIGRNDPCPCGSGKKYKKCCGKNK